VNSTRQRDGLVKRINRQIRAEIFSPHEWPLTEERLARRLGVSRTPVREVLGQMEKDNLIWRRNKKGTFLRKPSLQEMVEIYDLRVLLESYGAGLAAQKRTESDIANLEQQIELYDCAFSGDRLVEIKKADFLFHLMVIEFSRSRLLLNIVENLEFLSKSFSIYQTRDQLPRSMPNLYPHQQILDSIKKKNREEAAHIMNLHILWAKSYILEHLYAQQGKAGGGVRVKTE